MPPPPVGLPNLHVRGTVCLKQSGAHRDVVRDGSQTWLFEFVGMCNSEKARWFSKDVFRDVALMFMHPVQGLRGHEEKCDADRASPRVNVGRCEMV